MKSQCEMLKNMLHIYFPVVTHIAQFREPFFYVITLEKKLATKPRGIGDFLTGLNTVHPTYVHFYLLRETNFMSYRSVFCNFKSILVSMY